jgi:hypothetical protein
MECCGAHASDEAPTLDNSGSADWADGSTESGGPLGDSSGAGALGRGGPTD